MKNILVNIKYEKFRVLAYHNIVNDRNFEAQMLYLSRNYCIMDLADIDNALSKGAFPKKAIVITFDDGDCSFYYKALPILKKLKIPAILFVITDLINTTRPFWWDEFEYYLGREEGNKKAWEVKTWGNSKREAFLEELRNTSSKPLLKYKQLNIGQLKEMQGAGIMIANHSHTHPIFDKCTIEELEEEMRNSTEILRELGFYPDIFAYPNGNFSSESEAILKKYGIKQAYLFDHKIISSEPNPFRISRLIVNDTTPLWKFKLILSGWHTQILPITKRIGKIYRKIK